MKNPGEKIDILIHGGTLLPMTSPGEIMNNPLIGIRNGKIVFVESGNVAQPLSVKADTFIDASGCIVMPGLINVHTLSLIHI